MYHGIWSHAVMFVVTVESSSLRYDSCVRLLVGGGVERGAVSVEPGSLGEWLVRPRGLISEFLEALE